MKESNIAGVLDELDPLISVDGATLIFRALELKHQICGANSGRQPSS